MGKVYPHYRFNLLKSLAPTSTLADQIIIHKGIVPIELCNRIIQEYNDDDFVYGEHHKPVEDRNLHELMISNTDVLCRKNSYQRKKIDAELLEIVQKIPETHGQVPTCSDVGYSLRKMPTGNFYKEHTDQGGNVSWQLTTSLMLNDDYTGGEFCFFNRQLKYSLSAGDAISFPSNYLFPHEILEVTSGIRYVIVTWMV